MSEDFPLSSEIIEAFRQGVTEGIIACGRKLGYEGVCSDECGCMFEDFPACGSPCSDGIFGYRCRTMLCKNHGECRGITPDGCCPEYCPDFEEVDE